MPPTMIYRPGEVALILFPFTTLDLTKKRPAIVMNRPAYQEDTHDVILAAVTSQPCDSVGDISLQDWAVAGLLKPSWLRLGKLVTVHESLVFRTLGLLSKVDWQQARAELTAVLAD